MKADYVIYENSVPCPEDIYSAAEHLVNALLKKKETVSTAESCTGGLVGGAITSVSGASGVYNNGFITYANSAKEGLLGVKSQTLAEFGAVSPETCFEMAKGVCRTGKSELGISITGIAGPGGGTEEKPVGLVYIGVCYKGKVVVYQYYFSGTRDMVRSAAVFNALTKAGENI